MLRSAASLTLWLACPSLLCAVVPPGWSVDKQEWTGELAAGAKVRVENLHGDVRVRGIDGSEVELLAIVQHHEDDPRQVEVAATTSKSADGVTIAVRYPEDPPELAEVPAEWKKRRVDLTVFVPRGAPLRLETLHGIGQIKGLTGDVEVWSESGNLEISTAGGVQARTKYGNLRAQFQSLDWPEPPLLETVSGEVRADLPWDAAAKVILETEGVISSDFSIEVEWLPDSVRKRAVAEIGTGPRELRLTSVRGDVRLVRSSPKH